jgi:uncharacterized lipoprotein YddW (UPF0748 family)
MTHRSIAIWTVTLPMLLLSSATAAAAPAAELPPPEREFRGAWVATVANIDWPSRPGLPTKVQKQELVALIERAAELHFNAIIFQVRPAADALYASKLEPWSEFLTGQMGLAPKPFYDPLQLAIRESHRRGLELHAWFNPYRAATRQGPRPVAPNHVSKIMPDGVVQYGKYQWLDPGSAEAVDHSLNVILDVVRRYDIDGVHFDDYFYPYPINDKGGKQVPFPDDRSWQQAQEAGNQLDRDDWRRRNVDRLIERLAGKIKAEKPWVKFGISPFGIWKPGIPQSIRGFNAYAGLYADARKWTRQGWLDYITPQLYWNIDSSGQSYPVLLEWWHQQNTHKRHLWPGNFTSRVDRQWPAEEIIRQIEVTRNQPGATGNIHFSFQAIQKNKGQIADALLAGPYARRALVPASPWLDDRQPTQPEVRLDRSRQQPVLTMRLAGGGQPWLWVVRQLTGGKWKIDICPGERDRMTLDLPDNQPGPPEAIVVSAVSRTGIEGPSARVEEKP